MTFYAILGIPPNADEEAIRGAYRTLARRYHPDRGAGSSSEKFRELTRAYETLSDRERRHAYDNSLKRFEPRYVAESRGQLPQEDPRVFGRYRDESFNFPDDWFFEFELF